MKGAKYLLMKNGSKPSIVAWSLLSLFLMSACGEPAPEVSPVSAPPRPTPDVEATVTAELRGRLQPLPAAAPPVPLPPAAREDISTFAGAHGDIVGDLETFHAGFDAWRRGLTACEPGTLQVALRGFAAASGEIAGKLRALPRSPIVREVADKLVAAAEQEETALRSLRDGWRADDSTLFEAVDLERAAAKKLQREAVDALADLRQRTAAESRRQVEGHLVAARALDAQWDEFRRSYDSFRAQEPELESLEIVSRLSALVQQFNPIVVAARELPLGDLTRELRQVLGEAAEAEDLALRRLRSTFEKSAGPPEPAPPTDEEPVPEAPGEGLGVID